MLTVAIDLYRPVPVHIIFRSGGKYISLSALWMSNSWNTDFAPNATDQPGLCVSMATGYLFASRKYTIAQVVSSPPPLP